MQEDVLSVVIVVPGKDQQTITREAVRRTKWGRGCHPDIDRLVLYIGRGSGFHPHSTRAHRWRSSCGLEEKSGLNFNVWPQMYEDQRDP